MVVGKFAQAPDVSGVAIGSQIMHTVTGLISSFAMGTTILLGQKLGEGDRKIGGKIITPALTGSVLPGITRKSCVELLKDWGYEVEERLFSVDELFDALENGTLEEAWGTGTAAVVSPIGNLFYQVKEYTVSDNKIGELTQKLYDNLTGIQWGKIEDKHGWSVKVCNG
jgi:hypothetical protein